MYPVVAGNGKRAYANQDFVFRAPISWMRKRPIFAREDERVRLREDVAGTKENGGEQLTGEGEKHESDRR